MARRELTGAIFCCYNPSAVVQLFPRLSRLKLLGSVLFVLLPVNLGFLHAAPASQDIHFSELPLAFEANIGQYGSDIQFVGRSTAGTILLTTTGATLQLSDRKRRPSALKMIPVDASAAVVEGLDESSGKANYLRGRNPANWVTSVPRYFRVRYRHIYPGIDLIFHGSQNNLEYDFVVSPGADPNRIQLEFSGTRSIKLQPSGDLIITAPDGFSLAHRAPQVFQQENGVRTKVAGSYIIRGKNRISFQVGSYVRSQTLVIDPVVGYSALFGGSDGGYPFAIAADASGNAYVTGNTMLSSLPVLPGSFEAGSTAQNAVFIYKLNSAGTDFEYTTLIGGSSAQYGTGITVDGSGKAYVTGVTSSADFPVTSRAFQTTLPTSNTHGFVLELNAAGNALIYCTFLAGNFPDLPAAIAIDTSGDAYITGSTKSSTFPVTTGAYQTSRNNPDGEAFVTKLNSTGTALVYSTYLDNCTGGSAIALDSSGDAYVTGATSIGVVTKMNPTGSGLVYEVNLNAGNASFVNGIAVDTSGNAYVAGTGSASLLGEPTVYGSHEGIFVAKLNAAGTTISYLTSLGGNGVQQTAGLALDSAGNVYVTGWTEAPDFPLLSPVQAVGPPHNATVQTGILFKLDPTGALSYSTYFGSDYDRPIAIAVDPNSNVYVTGIANSTLFPVTPGAVDQTQPEAAENVYVAEIRSTPTCNFTFSSTSEQEPIAGGNGSIGVTAAAGCGWIALASQDWSLPSQPGVFPLAMPGITVTSPSGGGGSGAVTYSVPPNINPSRSTILSIAGTEITVSQPDGCTYQLSKSSISIPASGGSIMDAVGLTTGDYCPYTISNPAAWISIGGETGTGSAVLYLQVLANTGTAPRSAILIIAGVPFVVNQAGGYVCAFSVSPAESGAAGLAGSGTFQVSTSSGCSWTPTSNSDWLEITSVSSSYSSNSTVGTGNGTVYYSVLLNNSGGGRSGTITIGGTVFTVMQGGFAPAAVSATSSGSGTSPNFTLEYSDTAGAASLQNMWVWFGSSLASSVNSCILNYNSASNQVTLLANDGGTPLTATMGAATTLQNSQCSLNAATSSVVFSGDNLTLNLAMTFLAGYTGPKNIFMYAGDFSGANTGWQQRGTWTELVSGSGIPAAVSMTTSGSESSPSFALQYSDTAGATSLKNVWVWFGASLASSVNSCVLKYNIASNQVTLLANDGGTPLTATVGAATTLQNSQCSLNVAETSVILSGNNLTLNLAMTFEAAYAGVKNIYLYAADASGSNTGWQQRGTWTVTTSGAGTPLTVSVTPTSQSGLNQTFALEYSDTAGAASLQNVWVWFGASISDSANSCVLNYNIASNQVTVLANDGGTALTATLGASTTLTNSQCSLNVGSSSALPSGNTLTLDLAMTFQSAYAGVKNIYMYAADVSGANSGWQQPGSWTVP